MSRREPCAFMKKKASYLPLDLAKIGLTQPLTELD